MTTTADPQTQLTGETLPQRPRRRPFTVDEFWWMFESGLFRDQRVELINGEVFEMPSQSEPHSVSIYKSQKALEKVFGDGYFVRNQSTLRFVPKSCPDPDIAVVEGDPDDWAKRSNPTTALLVIEVAVTSLDFDLGDKADVYAAAEIADYWVLDVPGRTLTVLRRPEQSAESQTGWRYAERVAYSVGQSVTPILKPDAEVAVASLLPRGV